MDYLAGHDREFGAVGAPDNDELSNPAAHCDNADFLAGGYSRTRDQATASLMACVNQLRARFGEGVDSSKGLLDDQGQVIADEVNLDPECNPHERAEDRAKCASLEGARTGTARGTGLLRAQQLGRRGRPGPSHQ